MSKKRSFLSEPRIIAHRNSSINGKPVMFIKQQTIHVSCKLLGAGYAFLGFLMLGYLFSFPHSTHSVLRQRCIEISFYKPANFLCTVKSSEAVLV